MCGTGSILNIEITDSTNILTYIRMYTDFFYDATGHSFIRNENKPNKVEYSTRHKNRPFNSKTVVVFMVLKYSEHYSSINRMEGSLISTS